jgi:hypothetical protein
LLAFSFLTTIPLNIDRSFSVWMIKNLYEGDRTYSISGIETLTAEFFVPSSGEIKRRLIEQEELGNLTIGNKGEVTLTKKGEILARINSLIGQVFALSSKYSRIR